MDSSHNEERSGGDKRTAHIRTSFPTMFMVDSAPLLVTWSMITAPSAYAQCAYSRGLRLVRAAYARGLSGFIFVSKMLSHWTLVGALNAWKNHPFTIYNGYTSKRARRNKDQYELALAPTP